jgi:hypothetical protein
MIDSIRENAPILIVVLVFMCAFYLERIKRKTDAIHYILLSKTYPDTLEER